MDILEQIGELVRKHAGTIGLVLTWLGIAFVYLRRRSDWHKKHFLSQVNFSLNYVADNSLAMRTLLETTAGEVWLNEYGVRKVYAAAKRTTPQQPFILLPTAADRDFVNRAVLNVLSERFAETYLAQALGRPVQTVPFVFAITFERYPGMRTLKVRVLVIAEQTLLVLFGPGGKRGQLPPADPSATGPGPAGKGAQLLLASPVHRDRLTTLQAMYGLYAQGKAEGKPILGQLELGLPA